MKIAEVLKTKTISAYDPKIVEPGTIVYDANIDMIGEVLTITNDNMNIVVEFDIINFTNLEEETINNIGVTTAFKYDIVTGFYFENDKRYIASCISDLGNSQQLYIVTEREGITQAEYELKKKEFMRDCQTTDICYWLR